MCNFQSAIPNLLFMITLVQNSFFTTESQRAQRDSFYLAGRYRQIKSLLSLQNRDPILYQGPIRRLRFYSRSEGIYDPIAASRLDHKKSSSVYSVPPWWTWFQKGRMSSQKPNEINITPLAFELIWTAMSWFTNISFQERESLPPTTSNSSGLFLPAIRTGFKHALHERPFGLIQASKRKQTAHGKSGEVRSRRLDSPRRIQEGEEGLGVCNGAGWGCGGGGSEEIP